MFSEMGAATLIMGKDLGTCVYKVAQGNNDRTANEHEEGRPGSGGGMPKASQQAGKCRPSEGAAIWESVMPEPSCWD